MTPPPDYEIDLTPPPPRGRSGMPVVVIFAAICGLIGFAAGVAIPTPAPIDPAALVDAACKEGC